MEGFNLEKIGIFQGDGAVFDVNPPAGIVRRGSILYRIVEMPDFVAENPEITDTKDYETSNTHRT